MKLSALYDLLEIPLELIVGSRSHLAFNVILLINKATAKVSVVTPWIFQEAVEAISPLISSIRVCLSWDSKIMTFKKIYILH